MTLIIVCPPYESCLAWVRGKSERRVGIAMYAERNQQFLSCPPQTVWHVLTSSSSYYLSLTIQTSIGGVSMKAQAEPKTKISFLGLYFRQLIDPHTYVRSFNPITFWHRYRIKYLESCWEIDLVRHLERCHKLAWQPEPVPKPPESPTKSNIYQSLPWQHTPQHTIIIAQPRFELKYRGVTYLTNRNLAIASDRFANETSQTTTNSLEKVSIANRHK